MERTKLGLSFFFGSTLSNLTLDANPMSFRRSSYRSQIEKIVKHPYVWTDYIYHVGSLWIAGPFPQEDLLQEEFRLKWEDKTCFFTVVNALSKSISTSRIEERKSRVLPYRFRWTRAHNAIY